ncbi:TPA: CDP-glycerol glycerophosphotransferase family protein [Enterococcus faecium]|uniref:CDP-glycerol glycerophosphotransferase family protein n=1 Tax=Enterococcus faecium TaxID=1352 RepID=UPI00280D401C|nr:CDP-glycerol glycerophosphotransferase family protein [Enterococcus faecium]MDQ8233892.1 CDP-glycerol glycerophosphotransferase family protein [Enterococcus faecium]HAZ0739234.1 CDP-glycerol glycerophosphotransferase [Enterococcus faecium]HAZ1059716.1 CDP-glycerol glycerophosphotransferase [Enterococcus faecium]HAZ1066351.1 CDP-glycerol glycerophosphotransferase [Enterococcus faecium]
MKKILKMIKRKLQIFCGKTKIIIATVLYGKNNIEAHKIVVDNFLGKGYGGDCKYIIDELLNRKLSCDIVWLVTDVNASVPDGVRKVQYGTLQSLKEFLSAKIWISNVRNTLKPTRRTGQVYLQIWHGAYPVKYIEGQQEDLLDKDYVKQAKRDGHDTTAILVNSLYMEEIFRKYFWMNNHVDYLRFGYLRNDYLLKNIDNKRKIEETRRKLGIKNGAYVILYCPTFRDNFSSNGYIQNAKLFIENLERKYGSVVLLVRLHPNDKKNISFFEYNDKVINGSTVSDGLDLVLASDALITDYSSIAFDGAVLNKPVYILEKDIDTYRTTRGLSEQYDLWPFVKVNNEIDLVEAFISFDSNKYKKRLNAYYQSDISYDTGETAQKTVNWMLKQMSIM